jgi:Zn-dependent metalloprotease
MKPSESETMMLPPHSEIVHRENGTPVRIKGGNLSALSEASPDFQDAKMRSDFEKMAFMFLERYKKVFKLVNPRTELVVVKEKTDTLDTAHVFLQQVAGGIPVWGKTIVVHFNKENAIYLVQGDYVPSLTGVNTVPKIREIAASESALDAAPAAQSRWTVEDRSLVVFITSSQTPRLAYGITLAQGILKRELYFVDAENSEILHKITLTTH